MPPDTEDRSTRAQEFWAKNLDPQNLDRPEAGGDELSAEQEAEFAWAPDSEAAWSWLTAAQGVEGTPTIIDLGAGLGTMSSAFAGRGAHVIAIDTSVERLGQLRTRAAELGCADRITPLVASAEALPFAEGSIPGIYTKSVIIHTDIAASSAEIGRVLRPGGRAALTEPQPGNPFAWLYRNTLAPAEWKTITTYFTGKEQSVVIDGIGSGTTRPIYLFGFLAFVFQYARPMPKLFRFALGITQAIDRTLFAFLPPLRALAWFGLIEVEKSAATNENSNP